MRYITEFLTDYRFEFELKQGLIMEINEISKNIIDSSYKVHRALGPGLLESAYEACLCHELKKRGLKVKSQETLPVIYDGETIDLGYRMDLVVEDQVIVELKSVEKISKIHKAQILSYLKLSKKKLGLLINFNVVRIREGITRFANNL